MFVGSNSSDVCNVCAAALSVITNSEGGIIDDCIITRTGQQSFLVVSNAGQIKADLEHMKVSCH